MALLPQTTLAIIAFGISVKIAVYAKKGDFGGRRRNINLILDHGVGAPAGAERRRNINLI